MTESFIWNAPAFLVAGIAVLAIAWPRRAEAVRKRRHLVSHYFSNDLIYGSGGATRGSGSGEQAHGDGAIGFKHGREINPARSHQSPVERAARG